ncbi:hypothetical protein AMECASPLE_039175 [Ameca splendens]|uniref:Uncharacterized protein n=1 Tax=Ameca splendens TaxID=208324 RepID=A0ABV1AFS7_9TELE
MTHQSLTPVPQGSSLGPSLCGPCLGPSLSRPCLGPSLRRSSRHTADHLGPRFMGSSGLVAGPLDACISAAGYFVAADLRIIGLLDVLFSFLEIMDCGFVLDSCPPPKASLRPPWVGCFVLNFC